MQGGAGYTVFIPVTPDGPKKQVKPLTVSEKAREVNITVEIIELVFT